MNMKGLPEDYKPSIKEVEWFLNNWQNLPNYSNQEKALDKLFMDLCKFNDNIEDILIKCSTLNDFYSTNIYDVCSTVSQALLSRPGAGTGAIRAQLDRFRTEWGAALEKAKQHDNINGIAVEETKLAALDDVIAHFQEVAEA